MQTQINQTKNPKNSYTNHLQLTNKNNCFKQINLPNTQLLNQSIQYINIIRAPNYVPKQFKILKKHKSFHKTKQIQQKGMYKSSNYIQICIYLPLLCNSSAPIEKLLNYWIRGLIRRRDRWGGTNLALSIGWNK